MKHKQELKQSLLEAIADWISSEDVQCRMNEGGLQDHEDLHLKIAEVAFAEFERQATRTNENLLK